MKNDWLCKCGHSWLMHKYGLALMTGECWPTGCDAPIHTGEFCYRFIPDNLQTLEYLEHKSGKST